MASMTEIKRGMMTRKLPRRKKKKRSKSAAAAEAGRVVDASGSLGRTGPRIRRNAES